MARAARTRTRPPGKPSRRRTSTSRPPEAGCGQPGAAKFRGEPIALSPLRALEAWYARNCDGDWEHSFGVAIETLDNPGWAVRIDLAETALAGRPFETVRIDRAPDDWLRCAVEADVFKGHGGPGNLREILDAFARWADVEPRRGQASTAKVPAAG